MGLAAFNRMRREQAKKAEEVDLSKLKKDELIEKCVELGLEFDAEMKKADLIELLENNK